MERVVGEWREEREVRRVEWRFRVTFGGREGGLYIWEDQNCF